MGRHRESGQFKGHKYRKLGVALLVVSLVTASCDAGSKGTSGKVDVPGRPGAEKSSAQVRAKRRLFDGAPPVIPHNDFGNQCTQCHTERGLNLDGIGFAPPMPHAKTLGMGTGGRCTQCHVFQTTQAEFKGNSFVGLQQDLRRGKRLNLLAPPVMPHPILMRENCSACHDGPAAREEIRCPHPERVACTQCHVPQTLSGSFKR